MGYSFASLCKVLDQKDLFQGRKVLTLGTLYPYVDRREAEQLAERGLRTDVQKEKFSSHLFVEVLGSACCHSLDVSDYQQSEIICNLNHPLPAQHVGQYDIVFDGGTLEHLSNLSTALTNIFGLLRTGGLYYFGVPCNNWVDHGFFQFSPTFFRDLCIDNPGLELRSLHVGTRSKHYDCAKQNPIFMRALMNAHEPLSVSGIIRKNVDGIQMDLTQSKYRAAYKQASATAPAAQVPSAGSQVVAGALQRFIRTPWVSLGTKEWILNSLYRLKHGARAE